MGSRYWVMPLVSVSRLATHRQDRVGPLLVRAGIGDNLHLHLKAAGVADHAHHGLRGTDVAFFHKPRGDAYLRVGRCRHTIAGANPEQTVAAPNEACRLRIDQLEPAHGLDIRGIVAPAPRRYRTA